MDGVPTSPSGVGMSETVSAPRGRVQEKSQEPDGASVRSMDGPRGGSAARSVMSNHQNHPENGTFSAVAGQSPESQPARRSLGEVGSQFIPILPADVSAGDSAFRFLGSKTDPILHVSYPSPWNIVAHFAAKRGEISENSSWRREGDSNPRYPGRVHGISSAAPSATRSPLRCHVEAPLPGLRCGTTAARWLRLQTVHDPPPESQAFPAGKPGSVLA